MEQTIKLVTVLATASGLIARLSNIIMSYELICNANNLIRAAKKAAKGTDWKGSVQDFHINLLQNVYTQQQIIRSGKYHPMPLNEFKLYERGHTRYIKSHHIADRVIQGSFNENVLLPRIRPLLIYDNGASLKGKGVDFARKRFEWHLKKALAEYGDDACVVFTDYTKYFDNIIHETSKAALRPYLDDDEYSFIEKHFAEYEIDVSYMTDEEFANCMNVPFNSIVYAETIPESAKTGEKIMKKSSGIGAQTSQTIGVFYPNPVDTYCKYVRGLKYYGRYMDDTYIICRNRAEAKSVFSLVKVKCAESGLFINEKKTRIENIRKWHTFLKVNYLLLDSEHLIRKVHASVIAREIKKLGKFHRLLQRGEMPFEDIQQSYRSWRGRYKKFDSGYEIVRMDNRFEKIFGRRYNDE